MRKVKEIEYLASKEKIIWAHMSGIENLYEKIIWNWGCDYLFLINEQVEGEVYIIDSKCDYG